MYPQTKTDNATYICNHAEGNKKNRLVSANSLRTTHPGAFFTHIGCHWSLINCESDNIFILISKNNYFMVRGMAKG